jgi:uncharacterized membrane protein
LDFIQSTMINGQWSFIIQQINDLMLLCYVPLGSFSSLGILNCFWHSQLFPFDPLISWLLFVCCCCCCCCSRTDFRHYLLVVIGIIPILAHWKWRCDSNIMRRGAIFRCARMGVPSKGWPASGDNSRCMRRIIFIIIIVVPIFFALYYVEAWAWNLAFSSSIIIGYYSLLSHYDQSPFDMDDKRQK